MIPAVKKLIILIGDRGMNWQLKYEHSGGKYKDTYGPCRVSYPWLGEAHAEVKSSEVDIHVLEIYCGVFSGATSVEREGSRNRQRGSWVFSQQWLQQAWEF